MDISESTKGRTKQYNLRSTVIHTEGSIEDNIEIMNRVFPTSDLVIKRIVINEKPALIIYLAVLVDDEKIDEIVNSFSANTYEIEQLISNNTEPTNKIHKIEKSILEGKSILFIEGNPSSYIYKTEKLPQRPFMPPTIDNTLKGSKIAFVDTYKANIALLRRFIQSRNFQTKQTEIGTENKSIVSIAYIEGVVDEDLLADVEELISNVKVDSILNANQLTQLIERNPYSPFPQFLTTERPDAAAMELMNGKVVIILDRSAEVIILPVNFSTFFKSIDDYSSRSLVASFNRILRIVAFFFTIYLPGFYISIISFNYEVVPLKLLLSIGESRAKVPFDPLVEAIVMEITLEMLREAGIRLPSPISTTVGVVGGIVIGQAAVQAGIVSNIMVIVVALTAISSFIIPNYEMASSLRMIRFPIMIMASLFGIIGLIVSTMVLVIHGLTLTSIKVPYTKPFAPINIEVLKDTFIRIPLNFIMKNQKNNND